MESRQNETLPENRSTSLSLEKATQAGKWMYQHKDIILGASIFLYSAYQLVNIIFNEQQPVTEFERQTSIYSWYSLATNKLGILDHCGNLIKHSFPITSQIFKEVGLGIVAGMFQYPITLGLMALQHGVSLKDFQFLEFSKPKLGPKIIIGPLVTEIDRGICLPIFWHPLARWGLSSSYAITGAVLIHSAICAYQGTAETRVANFVRGIFSSGLTLFNDGSLWSSLAAGVTHKMVASMVDVTDMPAPGKK